MAKPVFKLGDSSATGPSPVVYDQATESDACAWRQPTATNLPYTSTGNLQEELLSEFSMDNCHGSDSRDEEDVVRSSEELHSETLHSSDFSDTSCGDSSDTGTVEEDIALQHAVRLSSTLCMFPDQKLSRRSKVVCGKIVSSTETFSRPCVVKFDSYQYRNEVRALVQIGSHSNIITLLQCGTVVDIFQDITFIALEKCHTLNLGEYVLQDGTTPLYDLNRGLKYCKQLINGMKFVHRNLIIHKDLKPSNILLTHDLENIKIADFGSSYQILSASSKVHNPFIFGTMGYRPPESLKRTYVSLKSDIYSLAVTFYFLLSKGKSPFGPQTDLWDYHTLHGLFDMSGLLVPNPVATTNLIRWMLSDERCCRPSIDIVDSHGCWDMKESSAVFESMYKEEEVEEGSEDYDETRMTEEKISVDADELLSALDVIGWKYTPDRKFDGTKLSDTVSIFAREALRPGANVYNGKRSDPYNRIQRVAVKLLKKNENSMREVNILLNLDYHPNIVKILESGSVEGAVPQIYIVMELCVQNLSEYIIKHKFDLQRAIIFFKQTASAVVFIHDNSIAHRDLNPSNILISQDRKSIKLSNFGLTKDRRNDLTVTDAGTEGFRAPEVYIGVTEISHEAADIFSLGICGHYIMTHGKHPFGFRRFQWTANIVHNGNFDLSKLPQFPQPGSYRRSYLKALFQRMLKPSPSDRPTAAQVREDVFFKDGINLSSTVFMSIQPAFCHDRNLYRGKRKQRSGQMQEVIVKLLSETTNLTHQIDLLAKLTDHANILKVLEYGRYSGLLPQAFIVTELCGRNLDEYISENPFTLQKAISFFQQAVSAIAFIHASDIVHLNLKPRNILISLDMKNIKVSCFGIRESAVDRPRSTVTHAGTEGFAAPEVYLGWPQIDGKADIFSLGICGHIIMAHGVHPFGDSPYVWIANIVANEKSYNIPELYRTPELMSLLERMLESNPRDRPNAFQVGEDKFFQGYPISKST